MTGDDFDFEFDPFARIDPTTSQKDVGSMAFERQLVTPYNPNAAQQVDAVERELQRRSDAYRRWWLGAATADDTKLVQADLERFCRANDSTFRTDARESAMLDGRREVFLRIKDFTTLSVEQLVRKYR